MAESAVSSVVRFLGALAAQEFALLRSVHGDAERLKAELCLMQAFLRGADAKPRDARVAGWVVEVCAAAYEAEDALEEAELFARGRSLQRGFSGALAWFADLVTLHRFGVKITGIQAKIKHIVDGAVAYGIDKVDDVPSNGGNSTSNDVGQVTPYWDGGDDDLVVGFNEERNRIVDELMDPQTMQVYVVSIVGMGGSGKSTLAKEIYKFPRIKEQFNAMGWIAVSQRYKFLDLIKDAAKKVMGITREKKVVREKNEGDEAGTNKDGGESRTDEEQNQVTIEELERMGEEEIREMLRKFLASRRYIVILDDVWRSNSYSDINKIIGVFPDANNGSRIVLTTRDMDVADHVNRSSSIHEMKLLDEQKSWELLEKKAFPLYKIIDERDKSQLTPIGMKLAIKCRGLPLALVVLGGYLSRNLNYHKWLGLIDNLDWEARRNKEPVWDILARSYDDLPNDQLRSCFLYATSFTEDYIIRVSRLSKLWIAEGFVLQRPNRAMEDTAREYINELTQRCMFQAVESSKVHGSIKSVLVHDVLRDWGTTKARREGLFAIWSNPTDPEVSSNSMPAYRLALHNFSGDDQIVAFMAKLRTLLVFGQLPKESALCSLKYLRVLHLYGLQHLYELPSAICRLIHLRYLGLQRCGDRSVHIPSSINDLLNLQTLDARGATVRSLPQYFWEIPTLRHLFLGEVYDWVPPKVGCLGSLQTLYFCGVCEFKDPSRQVVPKYRRQDVRTNRSISRKNSEKWADMIDALTEMKQLVLLHLESWCRTVGHRRGLGMVLSERLIRMLSDHSHLRVLELAGHSGSFPVDQLAMLPHSLRKLKLIGSRLSQDPMPVLGRLPNLVVLVLEDGAYKGKSMTCHVEGFPRLQHLTFHGIRDVNDWNIEVGAFPSLTHLTFKWSFYWLALPPLELLHATSLQKLHVEGSTFSIENVRKFKEKGCEVIIIRGIY